MSQYITIQGDTFDSISRKSYGTEQKASGIQGANPGVLEPLSPGISIFIPPDPEEPQFKKNENDSVNKNEVALNIEGVRFRAWDSVTIERSIDGFDSVQFTAPLSVGNINFFKIFTPMSFKPIDITVGPETLFTGTMLDPVPSLDDEENVVDVFSYSLPGVLEDCTAPASAFPKAVEFKNQNIVEIAKSLCDYFGIKVEKDVDVGAAFEGISLKPDEKIDSFLIKLAQQKNLIRTNTVNGALLFTKSISEGTPVARLKQGTPPLTKITPLFNPRQYYSHITGLEPTRVNMVGGKPTVRNSRLSGVLRPLNFQAPDVEGANVKTATQAKLSRMFANAVSYSVSVPTWRDSNDNLWKPNTFITVEAPGVMIPNEYEFIIRKVSLFQDDKSETAGLNIVLPGAFSGEIPEGMPWE